jgi:hypothetical protein
VIFATCQLDRETAVGILGTAGSKYTGVSWCVWKGDPGHCKKKTPASISRGKMMLNYLVGGHLFVDE